jgi:hypothetical protein
MHVNIMWGKVKVTSVLVRENVKTCSLCMSCSSTLLQVTLKVKVIQRLRSRSYKGQIM